MPTLNGAFSRLEHDRRNCGTDERTFKELGMAEERTETRPVNLRQLFPWMELFKAFQIALDPKKLILAAIGILFMALWWTGWSITFYKFRSKPEWPSGYNIADYKKDDSDAEALKRAWKQFRGDRQKWDLLQKAAGPGLVNGNKVMTDAGDLAESPDEFEPIKAAIENIKEEEIKKGTAKFKVKFKDEEKEYVVTEKPHGEMRTLPWFEDRGPNPYLFVFGMAGSETGRHVPWQKGEFIDWFLTHQLPVLIEPLAKFFRPVTYLLHANIGFWNFMYFLIVLVGTIAIWGVFGGAITRMAVVQIARKEKIGMGEAMRFTMARWVSYFCAPLFPLLIVAAMAILLWIFAFLHWPAIIGDIIVDGILWPLVLLAGLIMAIVLVGLAGWPMMYATISAEGSDTFDAFSRSYSYVYQSPWSYIWYCLVSIAYGAVVVFFVGFMGSLTVYLGKWGVSQAPISEARDPGFLFVYAPTSFQWRELLTQGTAAAALDNMTWYNKVGAFLVSIWLYAVFLIIVGFGYSFFWSAGSIIYLLMRKKVDDTEMDEINLEEEESEEAYTPPSATAPPSPVSSGPGLTMVDAPTLKPSSPKAENNPPEKGDGNAPG
jgi:hypothetical protein